MTQQLFIVVSIAFALGLIIWVFRWNEARRLRNRLAIQGYRLVLHKWLPFGPGARARRTAIYFVNYADASGQLFRALVADVHGALFMREQERIPAADDLAKFSPEQKDRWFYDPAAIYKP
jgi:hypothetical protein